MTEWLALSPGVAAWVAALSLLGLLVKNIVPIGRLRLDEKARLWTRISELEQKLQDERDDCDRKLSALQDRISGMERQFTQLQLSQGRARPLSGELSHAYDLPEDMTASLERIDKAVEVKKSAGRSKR